MSEWRFVFYRLDKRVENTDALDIQIEITDIFEHNDNFCSIVMTDDILSIGSDNPELADLAVREVLGKHSISFNEGISNGEG